MTAKDKLFAMAKGFRGRSKNCYRIAKQSVEKALQYAYRDRKQKKRDMRRLWIQRVNAGSKEHGVRSLFTVPFDFAPCSELHSCCVPDRKGKKRTIQNFFLKGS